MTIQEIIKLEKGTRIYRINSNNIEQLEILGFGNNDRYFFFISMSNYTTAFGCYIKTNRMDWETDYDRAKEILWEKNKDRTKEINEVYFENSKSINLEL